MNKRINYIFCVNTGRCGSKYLFNLFARIDGCVSAHEPRPICNKLPMQKFLEGDEVAMRALMPAKIEQIRIMRGEAPLYFESNHCFIKGFGWLLPEFIPQDQIGVIELRRDKDKVIDSYMRIEVTSLSKRGRMWLISPSRKNSLIPPPYLFGSPRLTMNIMRWLALPFRGKKWFRMLHIPRPPIPQWIQAFERATLGWYIDETYALGKKFKQTFPDVRYFSTTLEELNEREKVTEMLDFFGLRYDKKIDQILGVAVNLKRTAP